MLKPKMKSGIFILFNYPLCLLDLQLVVPEAGLLETISGPVSYTHLDVYKRQVQKHVSNTVTRVG